jgi:hypothetical protein
VTRRALLLSTAAAPATAERILGAGARQTADRKPMPGPHAAGLCAGEDGAYAGLSCPLPDAYEITAADTGARCA